MTETPSLTRRDRLRAATMEEITATARRLLVEQGPEAASLRAIAREMGMTAPGLYRYYGSREDLLRHVVAEIFRELAADIRRAIDEATEPRPAGQARQPTRLVLKMVAACQEFRRWSLTHRDEFALLFGVPVPDRSAAGTLQGKTDKTEYRSRWFPIPAWLVEARADHAILAEVSSPGGGIRGRPAWQDRRE